ncbi:hypothetical protein OED01_02415 [Microbacterium sp. M28]|uniref:hypothetical protein n=1 Tax=Microbacterium sp. M28 TaxID=2962064 RepID=UPI0021F4833B|nr:hypothetical protein [Microbacterium sp. M28]UYO97607.1 hypothetical protein OED01_02415 [Microbacterium sp. M28]
MNSDRKLRTRLLTAVPIAALAFSLAACGGSAAERPSTGELSDGITKILEDSGQADILTEGQVDCVSEALLESEISDQDLANIAEGEDVQTSQEAKDLVESTMAEAVSTCITSTE